MCIFAVFDGVCWGVDILWRFLYVYGDFVSIEKNLFGTYRLHRLYWARWVLFLMAKIIICESYFISYICTVYFLTLQGTRAALRTERVQQLSILCCDYLINHVIWTLGHVSCKPFWYKILDALWIDEITRAASRTARSIVDCLQLNKSLDNVRINKKKYFIQNT